MSYDVENTDEMIVQLDIPFYSFCEHHLLPFFGKAHVGYIPNGKIFLELELSMVFHGGEDVV